MAESRFNNRNKATGPDENPAKHVDILEVKGLPLFSKAVEETFLKDKDFDLTNVNMKSADG